MTRNEVNIYLAKSMTLFEVLSNDERIIVLSEKDNRVIITWNQSLTLQAWEWYDNEWEEVDMLTLSSEPLNYASARKYAIRWLNSGEMTDER